MRTKRYLTVLLAGLMAATAIEPVAAQPGRFGNPPLPPLSKKAMYYPRLDIGSLDITNRTEQWPAEVSARLSERLAGLSDGAVTVQVDGRRATLEGTVRTRAEADRLKHLAEFEPGVDEVIDQLRIEQPIEK